MKRLILAAIGSVCCLVSLSAQTALAQMAPYSRPGSAPANRPQLSPYLNLLRGGDPAANYYLGVVPERERRRNDAVFQREIADLDQRTQSTTPGEDFVPLRSTGHATAYGNTGTYFGSTSGQQANVNRPPTQQAARPVRR